jgi:hypothetical protein
MRLRQAFVLFLVLSALVPLASADQPTPSVRWVVVTAPAFRDAVEPLCKLRREQKLDVVPLLTTDVLSADEIRAGDGRKLAERVRRLCDEHKGPSTILLVGAVEAGRLTDPEKKVVPSLRGGVSRMKWQPTDHGYGSPGDELLPTVAVGRLPARTVAEAEQMVAKTLAHEADRKPGPWRRQLTVLAGIPAFNPFVDSLVERMAIARFDRIDPCWSGRCVYHNEQSRFCVPDGVLRERSLEMMRQGQALTLYLGHSDARGFYAGRARFLDREDWATLDTPVGPGVFVSFGCLGCQLSGPDGEGYGVAAVRNPKGPTAVLGSHGVCFAAMVQLAADGLFAGLFAGKVPQRLGDVWLHVLQGLARGKIDPVTYRLLDTVDGDSRIPQEVQRREHLEMFVLLGDPALTLPAMADDLKLTCEGEVTAGGLVGVRGEVPARLEGGKVRLTLERLASSTPADLQPLPKEGRERDRVMFANHERANRFVLAETEAVVRDGSFAAKLELPAKLPWEKVLVRAYAATERHEALSIVELKAGK